MAAERWFTPNFGLNGDYTSAAVGSGFTDSHILDPVLPYFDVWGMWQPGGYTLDPWFGNLAAILAAHGKKFVIGNMCYMGDDGSHNAALVTGSTFATTYDLPQVAPLYTRGGVVDYWVIDGYPVLMLEGGDSSQSNWNTQIINYMTTVHATYPNVKFVLDTNFPNWKYNGVNGFVNSNPPAYTTDYKPILDSMLTAIAAAGEKIWYFIVDSPYPYVWRSSTLTPGANWLQRILQLEAQVRSYGIKFGIFFNTDTPTASPWVSDQQYCLEALEWWQRYQELGGTLDVVWNASWYANTPSALLPTSGYTSTNLQVAMGQIEPTGYHVESPVGALVTYGQDGTMGPDVAKWYRKLWTGIN